MTKGEVKPPSASPEEDAQVDERPSSTPLDANIAMRCVLNGKLQRFIQCFEDEEDPFKETVNDMLNERDDDGKTPMDMAAVLGRVEMMKELINRGAEVNNPTSSGYTSLHHAACWGKVGCLKVLVENGADIQNRTAHGERPREIALRYQHPECVDFLDWAEAKQILVNAIASIRDTMADPDKIQGKLDRTDKATVTTLCNEKADWVDNTPDATTQDFITQKEALEEAMEPIWTKLSEPVPEKEVKK